MRAVNRPQGQIFCSLDAQTSDQSFYTCRILQSKGLNHLQFWFEKSPDRDV